jgi:hypothetical protein
MSDREKTAAERVEAAWKSRQEDFRAMLDAEYKDNTDDLPSFSEYGLAFGYVEPETFDDQPEGYFCYELSTGGPGDQLRFFFHDGANRAYRIEYWFLDWFDGASLDVTDDETAREVWSQFEDFTDNPRYR